MVYAVILFTLIVLLVGRLIAGRQRSFALRRLPAYDTMTIGVGHAVETGTATHVSLGGSAVRESSTVSALAGAEVAYQMAERSALADKPTLVTVSDPVTLSVGQNALRQAYNVRGVSEKYRGTNVHWYPQDERSLAFAAGVSADVLDENATTNVFVGRFGAESILAAESAIRTGRTLIAHSDLVEGQAVAYAASDTPLLGEELYSAPAYLERNPAGVALAYALDILRFLLIAGIILIAILAFLGTGV
jgi:hypothetical protein